jgi:hypothetical protein
VARYAANLKLSKTSLIVNKKRATYYYGELLYNQCEYHAHCKVYTHHCACIFVVHTPKYRVKYILFICLIKVSNNNGGVRDCLAT